MPPIPVADSPVEGMGSFTHGFADVNGTRIHYVLGGKGPAIVLLHGFPFTWAAWRPTLPLLAAAGFTVLAPDLRGMGHSTLAADGYAKTNVAEDIRAVVKSLALGPIDLVAMDIGTMVAYAYASRHPDEIKHLVLAEAAIPGFGLEEGMNPATGGLWHFGFHMQVELATALTLGREATHLMPFYKSMSASRDAEAVATAEFLPFYTAAQGLRGAFEHYGTLLEDGRANRAAFTSKISLPVLVLNGDQGIPQKMLLDGVQQVAEHVQADLVPHSGHTIGRDNPEWVAERLIRFLGATR